MSARGYTAGGSVSAPAGAYCSFVAKAASLAFGIAVGGLGAAVAGASHTPTSSQELRATIPVTEAAPIAKDRPLGLSIRRATR